MKLFALVKEKIENEEKSDRKVTILAFEVSEENSSKLFSDSGVVETNDGSFEIIDICEQDEYERNKQYLWRPSVLSTEGKAIYAALVERSNGDRHIIEIIVDDDLDANQLKIVYSKEPVDIVEIVDFRNAKEAMAEWRQSMSFTHTVVDGYTDNEEDEDDNNDEDLLLEFDDDAGDDEDGDDYSELVDDDDEDHDTL